MTVDDFLVPAALKNYVTDHVSHDAGSYAGKTIEQIDAQIQRVVERLRGNGLQVDADFDSYGSGWASFVDIFCSRPGATRNAEGPGNSTISEGIRIYVSRLAPLAVFGIHEIWRSGTSSAFQFLEPPELNTMRPDWESEWTCIRAVLAEHSILILPKSEAMQELPFAADLDTNLGKPPFRVFDALFHWSD